MANEPSLLQKLVVAAEHLDPQFQVTANQLAPVLSSLVHYEERGDEFLQAAEKGTEDLTNLLAPAPPEEEPPAHTDPTSPAPAAQTDAELEAQISDLQAQLASRQATEQQTVVEHETGAAPTEPPPPAAA